MWRRGPRHDSRPGLVGREDKPSDLLHEVARLELRTRGLVDSLFSGDHASVFHGHGLEFSHVREYQAGDDVRSIDWKVTARRGAPFVRQFVEERNLLVLPIVDISGSGRYGSGERSAGEVAVEIVATLALAAIRQSDRVGLLLVTDRVEHVLPPGSGRTHAVRLLADLLSHSPQRTGTDLIPGLDWVARSLHHRATVFVISDFILHRRDQSFRDALHRVARAHDLICVRLATTASEALPDVGWVEMTDPESRQRVVINTASRRVREHYRRSEAQSKAEMAALLTEAGADLIDVDTAADHLSALAHFFRRRHRTRR